MKHQKPIIHGRDHAPGGADPIPNWPSGGGGLSYNPPPSQPLNVLLSTAFGFDSGWSTLTLNEALYGGGYRSQASPGTVGHWVALPCTLGPKGSVWGVTFVHRWGANYGQASIDFATSSEDGLPGATGYEGEGLMQQPFDVSFVAYPTLAIDAYSATASADHIIQRTAVFRIGGNVGDTLTGWSTDPDTGGRRGNGGPGQYWLRFRVGGKNASSSGYQFDLQHVAVERIPGGA